MRYLNILIAVATALISVSAVATVHGDIDQIVYRHDIPQMLYAATTSSENARLITDVFCTEIDINDYSYEQLISWRDIETVPTLSVLIDNAIANKEIAILEEIGTLTAEDYSPYLSQFPARSHLIMRYFDEIFLPNIHEIPLDELVYYADYLPDRLETTVLEEIGNRKEEMGTLLDNKQSDFNNLERQLAERLKYNIENTIWTYFVEGHKQLNQAYSQIGIVPDNANTAADQYQRLVNVCFPVTHLQKALQEEVDKFCDEINEVRKAYAHTAGKSTYSHLSYKVPVLNLNSRVSVEPLWEISEARQRFLKNREDVSTGTSVLGWIFGSAVGLIAQGIGDWFAIDGLVESEYNARKAYMESVQKRLLTSFANYSNAVVSGIDYAL